MQNTNTHTQAGPAVDVGSGAWLGGPRLDFFAAHALQGLLASGKFTVETEDGEWATMYNAAPLDDDGNDVGVIMKSRAVELSWRIAEWMIKDQPTAQRPA